MSKKTRNTIKEAIRTCRLDVLYGFLPRKEQKAAILYCAELVEKYSLGEVWGG